MSSWFQRGLHVPFFFCCVVVNNSAELCGTVLVNRKSGISVDVSASECVFSDVEAATAPLSVYFPTCTIRRLTELLPTKKNRLNTSIRSVNMFQSRAPPFLNRLTQTTRMRRKESESKNITSTPPSPPVSDRNGLESDARSVLPRLASSRPGDRYMPPPASTSPASITSRTNCQYGS